MKVINSKLAAIGLAAFVFASCSDSSSDPVTPGAETTVVGLSVSSESAAALAARVKNYKNSTAKARVFLTSRAATGTIFTMPEKPTPSDDLAPLNEAKNLDGTTVRVPGKANVDMTANKIKNSTIYIKGTSHLTIGPNTSEGGNTFYVMPGGELIFDGDGAAVKAGDKVVNYGTFTINKDIQIDGTLQSTTFLGEKSGNAATQNVTINGTVQLAGVETTKIDGKGNIIYEGANIRAKKLTINKGANVELNDRVTYTDAVELNGNLHVANTFEANSLVMNDGAIFTSDNSIKVKNALTMNAGSTIRTNYLNVTNTEYTNKGQEKIAEGNAVTTLNGNCRIYVGQKGVLNFNILKSDNTDNQISLTNANDVAVVKADKFIYAGNDAVNTFGTTGDNQIVLLQLTKSYNNGEEADANEVAFDNLEVNASYLDYDKSGVTVVPKGDHAFELSGTDVTILPKLDLLSTVNAAKDTQSATCIQPANGKLYVSYHTRGDNHGANIEVASINNKQVTIDQSIKDNNNELDFNHLAVSGNTVYLAGSSVLKGGIVATINTDGNGLLNTTETTINQETKEPLQVIAINQEVKNGFDVNCVAKSGNYIVAATTRGYETWDAEMAHHLEATAGKAKHIALASDGKIYGLDFTQATNDENAAVNAEVQVFGNAQLQNPTKFNVGQVAPNNGKNTIAVDGDYVYVCKSANGLACYPVAGGDAKWEFKVPTNDKGKVKGYVNGVAVKGDYVYVAAGGYGLVVLNKADGKEVCHRAVTDKNSANYVAIDNNDNIVVAYGQSRVQVYRLVSTVKK